MAITVTDTRSREPGYSGQLISLGGVQGAIGQGRERLSRRLVATAAADAMVVFPSNQLRLFATFYNAGAAPIYLCFGAPSSSDVQAILVAGTWFQIDKDLPWTGALSIYFTSAGTLYSNEVSIYGK